MHCGLDKYWKRRILAKIPPHPTRLIDQACGTGILTWKSHDISDCRIIGIDLHREYLSLAGKRSGNENRKCDLYSGRAEEVVLKGTFDCITSSYLAKYADTERLLMMPEPCCVHRSHYHAMTSPILRTPFPPALADPFSSLESPRQQGLSGWRTVFQELPEFLRQTSGFPTQSIF